MGPIQHLYSFKSGGAARARIFYVLAADFGEAANKAAIFVEQNLDYTCHLKSITLVAESTELVKMATLP